MGSKDLRIGDWVNFYDQPRKVYDIRNEKVCVVDKNDCGEFSSYFHISPIPLTEKLLRKLSEGDYNLKNGQMYQANIKIPTKEEAPIMQEYISLSRCVFEEDTWRAWIGYGDFGSVVKCVYHLRNVKYVHELQHLFWGLGHDLKIAII